MTSIDWIFILLDFVGIIIIGVIFSRWVKTSEDMFVAGRKTPWWIAGVSGYMTVFSAGTFVVWGGIAYRLGFVAVTILMTIGIAFLFISRFVAAKWRKIGISSPAEYLGIRFGKSTITFYTWIGAIGRGVSVAVAIYAVAIIVVALVPLPETHFLVDHATGNLSVTWTVIIIGIIAILYTAAGGLMAVLTVDTVQFILLMVLVLMLVPFSIKSVGGVGAFIEKSPEGFFNLVSGEYSFIWLILWLGLNFFLNGGDWAFVQRYISVAKPDDSKKAARLVGILYIVSPVLWMLPAMIYRVVSPDANPEQAYILMSQMVLPAGMLGLMIAAMIAATTSMVDSMLNVYASVFTNDVFLPMNPDSSEKKLIRVGRVFTLGFGALIIMLALLIPKLGGAERVVVMLISLLIGPLAIPSVWGIFSKYISQKAVWISLGITYLLGIIVKFDPILNLFNYLSYGEQFISIIKSNVELTDAIIGFVVPIVILTVMEFAARRKGHAKGWTDLQDYMKKNYSEVESEAGLDDTLKLTVRILSYTMLVLGLAIGFIAVMNKENRGVLILFSAILLLIPGISTMKRMIKK